MAIKTRVTTYDDDSGDVVFDCEYDDNYIIKAIHKNTIKANERRKIRAMENKDLHENERYAKVYAKRWRDFLKREDVSDSEIRMTFACILNCFKHGGRELSFDNNVPLNTSDLIVEAGMTNRSGFRALSKLVERGILAKEKDGRNYRYYFNPYLVLSGSRADMEIEKMFSETEWAKELD